VEQDHPAPVHSARLFICDDAIAEELAQETWLAFLQRLDSFEGCSN